MHPTRLPAYSTTAPGETLLEVIIAISVITLILVPAGGLLMNSIQQTASSRNHLLAQSLANDGIAILSKMRDTNLLKFSAAGSACWNTLSTHNDLETCDDVANKLTDGSYILDVITNPGLGFGQWLLIREGDRNRLSETLTAQADSDYRLNFDPVSGFYNYNAGAPSAFYREIDLHFVDNSVAVRSLVRYSNGARVATVTRSKVLTSNSQ